MIELINGLEVGIRILLKVGSSMRRILFLTNRNLLYLDLEAQFKGLLCILDNGLDTNTMLITDIGGFRIGRVGIRNEAQIGSAALELPELVLSPGRAKTSHGIEHTYLMQPEHIRRTLYEVYHIGMNSRACRHIDTKDRFVLVIERRAGVVDILAGMLIILVLLNDASGKGNRSARPGPDRNHDPTTESINQMVLLAVLGHAQFQEHIPGVTFGGSIVDKPSPLRGSIADTIPLQELLIPSIRSLFERFLRFAVLGVPEGRDVVIGHHIHRIKEHFALAHFLPLLICELLIFLDRDVLHIRKIFNRFAE